MQDHLNYKDFLLGAKKGDEEVIPYYLEGWRHCTVSVGSKYMTIKPLFGRPNQTQKIPVSKGKGLLKNMYWKSASIDAHYKAVAEGKKKKPSNWESNYA